MRSDSAAFATANGAEVKEPFVVVELSFDDAATDLLYLTSHADADTPAGEQVIAGCLEDVSGTSQKLDQLNFNASIGSMRFSVVDTSNAFSSYLRTKLASDLTITNKRARFYLGYAGLDFADYALLQTQLVEREEVFESVYKIKCYDIQRQARKTIFERRETTLEATLDEGSDTITVANTSGFETYFHGPSYSVSPSSTVGHLLIKDGDRVEKLTYTGKTSNTFTGVTRGQFGTQAQEFVAASGSSSRKIKVYEYIYLELPAVKLAYAILTGSLYNDAATLPAHWHLGIDSQYIATSQFTTIGSDWWDTSDDTAGRVLRFEGLTKTDGKAFIETEILGYLGAFSPILSTGELGLKRLASVVSSAGYSAVLDYSNITKASQTTYSHDQVINFLRIDWAYDDDEKRFRASNFFIDPDSRDRYGQSKLKTLKFKGVHSAINTVDDLRAMFDGYRDRFAGPPIKVTLELLPSLNVIEVGDIVLVDLTEFEDYFGDSSFNRSMEVQNVAVNWSTGKVVVTCVGSTQAGSALIEYEGDEVIPSASAVPDAQYTNTGTDIETAFAANVTRAGSTVTVDSDFTLTGHSNINNSAAVYYVDGNFTLPAGRTITLADNVFLKIKGFFNCFGTIDGAGAGMAGEDARRYAANVTWDRAADPTAPASNWAERIDGAYAQQDHSNVWVGHLVEPDVAMYVNHISTGNDWVLRFYTKESAIGSPINSAAPFVDLDPATLSGLPSDLRGGGGIAGTGLYTLYSQSGDLYTYQAVATGGDGGNGGAGLAILARGMDFGAGGIIDLSGDNGNAGGSFSAWGSVPASSISNRGYNFKASNGSPGMPGCCYIFMDGANVTPPTISSSTLICNMGALAAAGSEAPPRFGPRDATTADWSGLRAVYYFANEEDLPDGVTYTRYNRANWLNRAATGNKYASNAKVQFLIEQTAAEDIPQDTTDQPLGISATEYTNTPETPEGNQSTIDITVTPPSATNYSHAIIQARKDGETGWQTLGPAQHERSFTTETDGTTWHFRALAVSDTGLALETGPTTSLTLGDFSTDFATIRPPVTVTGLRLTSQAAGTTFTTPDLQFTWNLNNLSGTGYTESWFSHFKVEIRESDGTLIYTETTKTNIYTLTYSENAALAGGPFNSLQIRVYQVTVDGEEGTPANVTFTNSAPAAPSGFSVQNGAYGSRIQWTNPSDVDFDRIEVYLSETSGFTPSVTSRVYRGTGESVDIANLTPATAYYYTARSRDTFGNYSSYITEASFTTSAQSVDWGDVTDTGGTRPEDNADVTQDAVDSGSVVGVDTYFGDNAFLRIMPSHCVELVSGTGPAVTDSTTRIAKRLNAETGTSNAGDYASFQYTEGANPELWLHDYSMPKSRKFKTTISYSSVAAAQNENLLLAVSTAGQPSKNTVGTGIVIGNGFGILARYNGTSSDVRLYGYVQESTASNAVTVQDLGYGFTDTGGAVLIECEYDHDNLTMYWRILAGLTGISTVVEESLVLSSAPTVAESIVFAARAEKLDINADDAAWQDYFEVGVTIFQQSV